MDIESESILIEPKEHLRKIYRTAPEEFDRTEFLRLDKNEDPEGLPKEFIKNVLSDINPDLLSSYPQVYPLYEKLGSHLNIDEKNLLVTAGSDAAIKNIFEVFIIPGDEIILPDPTYAMYNVYSELFCAKVVTVPYDSKLSIDVSSFTEKISDKTKMIVIANPNSPTGTIIEEKDIISILRAAKEKDILVLIDEAYYPYYPRSYINLINEYDNLLVTRTFSKAYCLSSLRIGFVAGNEKLISYLNVFRPIYEITGISSLFAVAILDQPQILSDKLKQINEGKIYLEKEMQKLGIKTYRSYANFVHIEVGRDNVNNIVEKLYESKILVKSGFNHITLKNCIRVSLAPMHKLEPFVKVMQDYVTNSGNTI